MKRHNLRLITILTIFLGCQSQDGKFSKVKKLSTYKQTEFLPTLEHNISKHKNAIYSATLLFAWAEIRNKIEQPIDVDLSFTDLRLLNNSKSFLKVLNSSEYSARGEVDGEAIRATAVFSKSLPFEFKLTNFTNQLTFDGKKVASFGQFGHEDNPAEIIQILYYENDNNFIIKLSPKDKQHEIILFKSNDNCKTMSETLSLIATKIEIGKKEKLSEKIGWRYYLTDEDIVVIPKLNFNIEENYSALEGKRFKAGSQSYLIEKAYQRTAFILDESGAEIESAAEVSVLAVDSTEAIPHPKKMRFDKPFFLMLRRTDSKIPYFGLWTSNTELMLPEK